MSILHSKSRLEAFSDGVFAFAATLLVVSLEIPDTFAEFKAQLRGFWGFGLSFLALVLLWKVHYNFFRRSKTIDNITVAANMTFLFTILFFVFPLKFLVTLAFSGTRISMQEFSELFMLYGLGFVMIFACISFMYYWSYRHQEEGESSQELIFYARHFFIFVVVGLLSIAIAFFKIGLAFGLPGLLFMLLGPLCFVHGTLSKDYK